MRLNTHLSLIASFVFLVSCGDKNEPGIDETNESTSSAGGTGTTTTTGDTSGSASTTTTTGSTTGSTASTGLCGTNSTSMTYAANASVVLNAACTSCHSPSGTQSDMPLDTMASAVSTFKNHDGKNQVDTKQMPLSGSLTTNQICVIDYWVTQGYN